MFAFKDVVLFPRCTLTVCCGYFNNDASWFTFYTVPFPGGTLPVSNDKHLPFIQYRSLYTSSLSDVNTLVMIGVYFVYYSDASLEAFETWTKHDDAQDNFCELDGKYISNKKIMILFNGKMRALH